MFKASFLAVKSLSCDLMARNLTHRQV